MRPKTLVVIIYILVCYKILAGTTATCSKDQLSFYEILLLPDDGFLVDPAAATTLYHVSPSHFHKDAVLCEGENKLYCQIFKMRQFLPSPDHFLKSFQEKQRSGCDASLSNSMSVWIKTYSKIESKPGFPCETWGDKVSIGKYLRYNAAMQYNLFKGFRNDTLIDFNYESTVLGWPWTDQVENCNGEFKGWNCAFERFNATKSEYFTMGDNPTLPSLSKDISMEEIFRYHRLNPNHIVQLLFFGKIVSTISEPSLLAQRFFLDNVVSVNEHIWSHRHNHSHKIAHRPNTRSHMRFFSSFEDFVDFASDVYGGVKTPIRNKSRIFSSVSMHVRRGDSCDVDVDVEIDIDADDEEETLVKDGISRPCYNVSVYMNKLHYLRRNYNVKRVYLSTDSYEMIEQTRLEPQFNWVYVNNDRLKFSMGHGWVEKRPDEDNEETMMSAVADLNLMRHGDIFLGAFSSHYSKLAYYIMCGHGMRIPPFISVDLPLPCTPFMECSKSAFRQTNLSMSWMFDLKG